MLSLKHDSFSEMYNPKDVHHILPFAGWKRGKLIQVVESEKLIDP
jgi:hypothetical protein